ncbi:hypothetical protein AS361_17455 [Myroides marinus]|nr:hypothetical protein AS361_17455 [Myroides marinus]
MFMNVVFLFYSHLFFKASAKVKNFSELAKLFLKNFVFLFFANPAFLLKRTAKILPYFYLIQIYFYKFFKAYFKVILASLFVYDRLPLESLLLL